MEPDWLIISIVIVAALSLIVFLIWRNQKDKKELTRKLIDEEKVTFPKEPDTEVETTECSGLMRLIDMQKANQVEGFMRLHRVHSGASLTHY
jgi:FtsZ-interacting cell division protein ZipA